MEMQRLLLYISPLIISTVLGVLLALYITRHRFVPGASALMALILAASLWSLGYTLEIALPDLHSKLFWAKFEYLGITGIPIAWFIFVTQYLGSSGWLTRFRRYWAVMGIMPILTLALVWTNEAHGLVWRHVQIENVGSVRMLEIQHGPWFWINLVYSYCLLLLGSIMLARRLPGSIHLHRWQIRLALLAILIPWFGNLVYISDLNPAPDFDWTPFSFIIAGLLLTLSLSRFRLVHILPIAQKAVFAGLADCVLVLDMQDCVVDLNNAAEKMIEPPGKKALGQPLDQVLPELAEWAKRADYLQEFQVEITQGEAPSQRFYNLHIAPLRGPYPVSIGRLVVLHEITQHKQEQAQLERARAHLEETVLERTEALRQAVEQLQRELIQRTLAEKRFEEVVEAAPDALLLVDQSGYMILVNPQVERLFGYPSEELVGRKVESLIPERYCDEYNNRLKQFIANPSTRPVSFDFDFSASRKDGSEFPAEISLGSLSTGESVWVACNIRDISMRKRAELALQESMQTYQVLFENAGDAIFLLNLKGKIQQANQKAADLLGYSREELQVLTIRDIVIPEEYQDAEQKLNYILNGHSIPPYVRYLRNRAGKVFPVEANLVLVHDGDGQPKFFQSIVRDISERIKAEQAQNQLIEEIKQSREQLRALALRLQEAREFERRQIAAELHDRVGQNLTGLNLNLQIIRNQLNSESKPAVHSRLIDSLKLAEETTRQVRDVMADLQPPLLDEYGLVSALNWYAGIFSQRTGITAAVIGDEFDPRLPPGKEMALFRMVQEALNNVVKHAQATQVMVLVESNGAEGCLTVEDDGQGFDPQAMNAAGNPPHWGFLTMQQRAVSLGGQIVIDSAPGQGTRVSVRFERGQDGS
jgi:PAS domain S-box-containing protein